MTGTNLNAKKLSLAVSRAGTTGFSIDTSHDRDLLEGQNYNWDELNKLKEELGSSVLEFVGHVNSMLHNPDVVNNLGDQASHFTATIDIFFKDITEFSGKIKDLREQHEHLSGPVNDLNQLSLYNRLAMSYHSLCSELTILVGPTISELVLTVSKIIDKTKLDVQTVGDTNVQH